jgi:uncharacterized protein DUF3784
MITPIIILSSFFIAIAFIVNESNAKTLLSGYNTMSEEERQQFDIKSYIPFFRRFHIFLGISLLVISLILFYLVNRDWCVIFITTYPIIAYFYFIRKGIRFSKEPNKKQKTVTYIVMLVLLIVLALISFELINNIGDIKI